MKEQRMCKNDLLFMVGIFLLSLVGFIALYGYTRQTGDILLVQAEGEELHRYSLSEDQVIQIGSGSNVAEIKEQKVYMVQADCPDQFCVRHRPIFRKGEQIICLPNRVILQIQGGEEAEFDSITH